MIGAGFAKDMLSQAESNRNTLKGIGSHLYHHFDTAYITDSIVSRRPPRYREARPDHLQAIRDKLSREEKRLSTCRILVFAFSVAITLAGMYGFWTWIG